MFARMRARIEAAAPFPLIGVVRIADALGGRTGMNIAEINLPAFLSVVCRSAAGEFVRLACILERGPRAPGFPSAQQRA